jgi:hypothetical protein
LLGTDVGASLVLLRRKVLGQKLTSREKKILKRTATDIASVVPIGILMLLPVSCWKTWYLICLKLTVENLVDSLQHQRIRNQPAFSYMTFVIEIKTDVLFCTGDCRWARSNTSCDPEICSCFGKAHNLFDNIEFD